MIEVDLRDKYELGSGRVFLSGAQALVRLPIDQARRDAARGFNTAGFISGYRGSPLGVYDSALWRAEELLRSNRIHFEPGVNEDLAAASVWGTQQVPLIGKARYDGVFSLWYGKGPGVDRSADVIKHGNFAGTSARGGVVLLCGDDHAARSSTVAHQSDHVLVHCGVPVLNPANIQDYLDLGLFAFDLSRYSGCWIGFKCVTDTVDGSASVFVDPERVVTRLPLDYKPPADGLSIRIEVAALRQEARLFEERLQAVKAFARANEIDRQTLGSSGRKKLGIVATGKAWGDVCEAIRRMGLTSRDAERLGIGLWKTSLVWPLEPQRISAFAGQCDELLVIEEKRGLIEEQLASLLYHMPADRRPRLIGKRDEQGKPFLPETGELEPDMVTRAIAERIQAGVAHPELRDRVNIALQASSASTDDAPVAIRTAAFCAGCPHNTSTVVPDGSLAIAGIGCHGLAGLMPERNTITGYHMGGEGAPWIGLSPFLDTRHIFQNLGDGTYFHSGLLAIRACVAAKVNITYKILLNGAVGMTGGQPIEGEEFSGEITAPHVANQVHAEGVKHVAIVSDDVDKFRGHESQFPPGTTFAHRSKLDEVQRELRECEGVSVLIYDQSCATERRRLRKRGKMPDSEARLFIHEGVCEGCGDCGAQSNCIALEPIETDMGRKRRINQSVCNTDLSCLKGFCPSFVTVTGGKPKARGTSANSKAMPVFDLPEVEVPRSGDGFSMLVAGIGGNGVITIGAVLGMAAHMEGCSVSVLDNTGFAQRNGSVMSHIRICEQDGAAGAARIPSGSADLVIGCDAIVAASAESLTMMTPGDCTVVMNTFVAPTSAFANNPDLRIDPAALARRIAGRVDRASLHEVDATEVSVALLGDVLGANMLLVGYAWQAGRIPLSHESIEAAVRLNGAAVQMNLDAFTLGRLARARPEELARLLDGARRKEPGTFATLDDLVQHRKRHLTDYQDAELAERYAGIVERVDRAEHALGGGASGLAWSVAENYAKLLARKDEYEVARLFSQPKFREEIESSFSGDIRLRLNLAPSLLSRRDKRTGRLQKREFGGWILHLMPLLAKLKWLRKTHFDIFGKDAHRRMERALISEYEQEVEMVLARLDKANHAAALKLLKLYDGIRGYDVVKEQSVARLREQLPRAHKAFEEAIQGAATALPGCRP